MPIYFNAQSLPSPQLEYVSWVDIMGIGPAMAKSISIAANFIFKLHVAAVTSMQSAIRLYPVMDGFYATCSDQNQMLDFLANFYDLCAEEFIVTSRDRFEHKFLIRGALAFGPIIHGSKLPASTTQPPTGSNPFLNNNHKSSVLLGLPMVQAHESEKEAPPFGIFIHESARTFSPSGQVPIHFRWWKWGLRCNSQNWSLMRQEVANYFNQCMDNRFSLAYLKDRIDAHREMASQYFT